MRALAAFAALVLAAPVARAEERKDESTAFALSATGTLISTVLLAQAAHTQSDGYFHAAALGLAIAPSLGHWYAGEYLSGGMVARAGGAALVVIGSQIDGCEDACDAGMALMMGGAATFVAGVLWDVATAPKAARSWNKRHEISITPSLTSDGGGLSLGGSF